QYPRPSAAALLLPRERQCRAAAPRDEGARPCATCWRHDGRHAARNLPTRNCGAVDDQGDDRGGSDRAVGGAGRHASATTEGCAARAERRPRHARESPQKSWDEQTMNMLRWSVLALLYVLAAPVYLLRWLIGTRKALQRFAVVRA